MSLQRAIRRRRARKNGWRYFSGARLRAMARLAEMRALITQRMAT